MLIVIPESSVTVATDVSSRSSLPDVPGSDPSSSAVPSSSMTHHLDLVRSGVASIETELQQRASLLAVDNTNLRYNRTNRTMDFRIHFPLPTVDQSSTDSITV